MYRVKDIPIINKALSISREQENDMTMINIEGELKTMLCDPNVLQSVLKKINGKSDFKAIEDFFEPQYGRDAVKGFLSTLLEENIIKIYEGNQKIQKQAKVTLLGEGELKDKMIHILADGLTIIQDISIDDFLSEEVKKDNDMEAYIVILGNANHRKALDLNQILMQQKKPFLWISYNGKALVLGPSVLPWKTACLECYVTQNLKKLEEACGEEISVGAIQQLRFSYEIDNQLSKTQIEYAALMMIEEINNLYSHREEPQLVGRVYHYHASKMSYPSIKKYSPITSCGCCNGMNKHVIPYQDYKMLKGDNVSRLTEASDTIVYQAGGFRSASLEKTIQIVKETLERMNLDIEIKEADENPFYAIIPAYSAKLYTSYKNTIPYFLFAQSSQGKGINQQQAYFSAAFELFERMSARYYGEKQLIVGSVREVGDAGIDIISNIKQLNNRNNSLEKYNIDKPIDWIEGKSLMTAETKLVPASMVFLSNTVFRGQFFNISSSGLSAGATLEDAILQGLFEVIEHDAWIIGQANQITLPQIDIYTTKNEKLKKAIHKIEENGYEIITRDYTNDLSIPVFRTWIINHNDYLHYATNGFGASISAEIALERSITEAVQSRIPEEDSETDNYSSISDYEAVYSYDSLYSLPYFVKKDMKNSTRKIDLSKYEEIEYSTVAVIMKKLTTRIKQVLGEACDVVYVDLTRESIGIPTVRVIITGDIQRTGEPLLAVSDRMFAFQKKMKYSEETPTYEELYMGPYPH